MAEELIRAACEAANCKYPDMEAMANFKREVTPSVVIGLIDGLRHAKGMAAINDARANGAAETIQHLRDDIAELRARLPSQGGEAVGVWLQSSNKERYADLLVIGNPDDIYAGAYDTKIPLYTHPADQVADDLTMVKVSRELANIAALHLENSGYTETGKKLRALLNGGRDE